MSLWISRYHPLGYRLIPRYDVLFMYVYVGPYCAVVQSSEFKVGKLGHHLLYLPLRWKESGKSKQRKDPLHKWLSL